MRSVATLLFILAVSTVAYSQTQALNINGITIAKQRSFPASIEIRTANGFTATGTGPLTGGPIGCTHDDPCLAGTRFDSQLSTAQFVGTLNGRDVAIYLGDPGWIDPTTAWTLPFLNPFGRPVVRVLPAVVRPVTVNVFEFGQWAVPMYSANVELRGSMRIEMEPLHRAFSPRPFSEFRRIDIDLVPGLN